MLFDYIYILNNFDPDFFNNGEQTGDFIVPVNGTVMTAQPALFQTFFRSAGRFCFSISDNIAGADKLFLQRDIVQNFTRLLFLPNYLRMEGRHIFFINPNTDNHNASLALGHLLREEFGKQGIDIALVETQHTPMPAASSADGIQTAILHGGLNEFLCAEDNQANFETFTKSFWLPSYFNKKWVIPVSTTSDLCKKKRQLEKFELWLKGTQSSKVKLIEMVNAATAINSALTTENKLLAFKLENSAHYLKLIRQESMGLITEIGNLRADAQRGSSTDTGMQGYAGDFELVAHYQKVLFEERKRADDTFNWYQKEYEVLPLWFKRIGQLIKVLMGKRSFSSLFNKSKHDQGRENTQQNK